MAPAAAAAAVVGDCAAVVAVGSRAGDVLMGAVGLSDRGAGDEGRRSATVVWGGVSVDQHVVLVEDVENDKGETRPGIDEEVSSCKDDD